MSGQRDDAAERSAHVNRGEAAENGPSLFVEGPGPSAQLRVVVDLEATIAALRADNERLRKALREIIDHCGNSGYGNPIVDNRTVDRCEDTARAALSEPAP